MASRKRKGMIIKNTGGRPVEIDMETRTLVVGPGEEKMITAKEVRDPTLREVLQIRGISIVRPATEEESDELARKLKEGHVE